MVWGDVNGDVWIFQEDCLKEANLAGRTAFFHSCLYSFFWPETPAAILKQEVNLNMEVKCQSGREIVRVSDDIMKQLYQCCTAYSSFVLFYF